jgi:hypothetical protein
MHITTKMGEFRGDNETWTLCFIVGRTRSGLTILLKMIQQLEVHCGLFNKVKLKRLKSDFLSFLKMAELPKAKPTELGLPNRVVKS